MAVPTLVLCGSNDRANIALSRELAAGIPTAELRVIPGATHLWNLQQPDAFNKTVAAFVQQAASPRALRTPRRLPDVARPSRACGIRLEPA